MTSPTKPPSRVRRSVVKEVVEQMDTTVVSVEVPIVAEKIIDFEASGSDNVSFTKNVVEKVLVPEERRVKVVEKPEIIEVADKPELVVEDKEIESAVFRFIGTRSDCKCGIHFVRPGIEKIINGSSKVNRFNSDRNFLMIKVVKYV